MTNRDNTSKNGIDTDAAAPDPAAVTASPAYFHSLSIEHVRCFGPRQTLDLSDGDGKPAQWTIILGLNGTGKTTLLQLLACSELVPTNYAKGHVPAAPRMLNWPTEIRPAMLRGEGEAPASWTAEFAVSRNLVTLPNKAVQCSGTVKSDGIMSASFNPSYSPWCCAYGAGRRMGAASLSESEFDDATASLFSERTDLRNPEEWLIRLDYAAAKPSAFREQQKARLSQVKQLLLSVLPDDEIEDIRFTVSKGTNPKASAEFKTAYGWVPLRNLGYGYQTLITWVSDLANRMVERYPNSPDPLAEPAVVLVDEIDLHLHPIWQRKLMDFLTERFPNTQFIATAHSPLVAQAAADANLAVLRREGDHVVIDNDVDNIRGWRIDQILTSDLFGLETARPPQIEGLLAERKKLLTKSRLSKDDQRRLSEIEEQVGNLPTGETAQDVKEREEIRKTLELLKKELRSSR